MMSETAWEQQHCEDCGRTERRYALCVDCRVLRDSEHEQATLSLETSLAESQKERDGQREANRIQKAAISWLLGPPINGTTQRTRWNAHAALLRELVDDYGWILTNEDGEPYDLLRRINEALERHATYANSLAPEIQTYEARILAAEQQLAEAKAQLDGAMIKHAEKEAWIADLLAQLDAQAGVIKELGEVLEWFAGDWQDGWSRLGGIIKWMDSVDDELVRLVGPLDREVQRDLGMWVERARIALAHAREPETK